MRSGKDLLGDILSRVFQCAIIELLYGILGINGSDIKQIEESDSPGLKLEEFSQGLHGGINREFLAAIVSAKQRGLQGKSAAWVLQHGIADYGGVAVGNQQGAPANPARDRRIPKCESLEHELFFLIV